MIVGNIARSSGLAALVCGILFLSACESSKPEKPRHHVPDESSPSTENLGNNSGSGDKSGTGSKPGTSLMADAKHDIPRPRVMVVAQATAGLDEERDDEAQSLVESVLQEQGFETIDAAQLDSVKSVDELLNPTNKDKILALNTRFGCEVLVVVKYDKQMVTGGNPGQFMWWYLFNGKAIRTDTASHIASKSTKSPRPRNSQQHFVETANLFGKQMSEQILKAWQREMAQGLKIQLMVSRGDAHAFNLLQGWVGGIKGTVACNQRRFQVDTCEYEVNFDGTRDQFVAELGKLPGVRVTGYEANRVDAEFAEGPPPPPADTTPPNVKITAPANGVLLKSAQTTVTGTVDDSQVKKVQINGYPADVSAGKFSLPMTLREGQNDIVAIADDAAGNRGQAKVSLTVDTVPPEVTITSPQSGKKFSQTEINVGVRVVGDDIAEVTVNGAKAELFRAPDIYKATIQSKDGAMLEIVAKAKDKAGNEGSDKVNVSVDTTPPQVEGQVTVIVSGRVDDASNKVRVNGQEVKVNSDGTWETTVDISANKVVTIEAEDDFGNITKKVIDYGK